MPEDKPELSSTELLRQAREEFAPPKLSTRVSTQVAGATIEDLLALPLSSDSLLPQRAVDHWAPSEQGSSGTAWEQIGHSAAPMPEMAASERASVARTATPVLPPPSGQPPVPAWSHDSPPPPWLQPTRDELGSPPAARGPERTRTAPRPSGPPAQPPRRANVPWRLVVAGLIGVFALFGMLTEEDTASSSSSSSSNQVRVGDCYNTATFEQAAAVDCSQLHRVQIFALVGVTPDSGGTMNLCFNRAVDLRDSDNLPNGTVVPEGTFVGAIGASSTNSASTFCYLESPSGDLVGSVLPE